MIAGHNLGITFLECITHEYENISDRHDKIHGKIIK